MSSVAEILAQFSEWSLYHAAIGKGIQTDLPETKGLLFTSAISPAAHATMRQAERLFRVWHDQQLESDKQKLSELEEAAERDKRDARTLPWASTTSNAAQLAELRERLSRIPAVTWREQDTHKSTLVELLKRSAYGAITYVDEYGARAAQLSHRPSDFGWVSLTGGDTADSALIRASSTGGACIHSLVSGDSTKFNYLSSPPVGVVKRLLKKISDHASQCCAKGYTVCVPVDPEHINMRKAILGVDDLLVLLKSVYATDASRAVVVRCETDALRSLWDDFVQADASYYTGKPPSKAAASVIANMPANFHVLASFATRAVITQCVVEAHKLPGFHDKREAILTERHLTLARTYAAALFRLSANLDFLEERQQQASNARAALHSADRVEAAYQAFLKLVESSDNGKVAFTTAIRTQAITTGLLGILVEQGRIEELQGVENIGMGKTKRAYVIPGTQSQPKLFEQVNDATGHEQKDPEEAVAEYEEACREYEEHGTAHSGGALVVIYRELQEKAERNSVDYGLPAVPLSHMSSQQIEALPALLHDFAREVKLRGTADYPEPEALFSFEDDDILRRDVPNLWFRFRKDGKPLRDWRLMKKMELTEWGNESP